jgi:hypothetical protein
MAGANDWQLEGLGSHSKSVIRIEMFQGVTLLQHVTSAYCKPFLIHR